MENETGVCIAMIIGIVGITASILGMLTIVLTDLTKESKKIVNAIIMFGMDIAMLMMGAGFFMMSGNESIPYYIGTAGLTISIIGFVNLTVFNPKEHGIKIAKSLAIIGIYLIVISIAAYLISLIIH